MSRFPQSSALGLAACLGFGGSLSAADSPLRLPDEIEAVGGQGTAQGHSGVASLSDLAAIRVNPAMLYKQRSYDISGAYYWPATGRPFYKAGVIDGITSRMVAGFEYTGFQEPLKARLERTELDSPVQKRASVALAIPTQFFSLGFTLHYVEAEDPASEPTASSNIKGISLGLGAVAFITDTLRAGVSVQNFNNRRVEAVAPMVMRAGLSWEDRTSTVMVSGDFRQRERTLDLELPDVPGFALSEEQRRQYDEPERMALLGLQVKTFNMLKIFAGYGQTVEGPERSTASGGVGIYQKSYSFAYALSKNFPAQNELQSSLHLTMTMKM